MHRKLNVNSLSRCKGKNLFAFHLIMIEMQKRDLLYVNLSLGYNVYSQAESRAVYYSLDTIISG